MRARGSVVIAREPADVFAYVSDPSNDLSWRSYLVASHAVDAELTVGSIIRQTYSYQGRSVDVDLEVTDYAPPEHIGLRARGKIPARINLTCAPESGGTRFNMSGSAELTGPASLFEGRIQRELDQTIATDLKRLKAALEGSGDSRSPRVV
ncbi:MAG: SRPBCC family protein [Coriobacteriia bacterium]|nr:SRPBCC family protein [Coriobacteriia bacterium]